jgi:hypothetical protein
MTLNKIVDELALSIESGGNNLNREITRGYASDLMSDVIANTLEGDLWITLQVHLNIVAVAVMKELSGIIIIGGRTPEPATLEKAEEEGLPILVSTLPAFEVAGRLYQLGISGIKDA